MTHFLRKLVSGSRNRYIDDEFNLDLSYISPSIIAMSVPSTSAASFLWRNPLTDISRFLNSKHPNHYMIFNLSEMEYQQAALGFCVQNFSFPDHHNPPLNLLFVVLRSLDSWLMSDPKNVAVIHCKAGKSRTGLVIAAYLLWKGEFSSVSTVLEYFLLRRGEGISSPSQLRYLEYFWSVITQHRIIKERCLHLRSLFVHGAHEQFRRQLLKHRIVIQIYSVVQVDVGDVRHVLKFSTNSHDMDTVNLMQQGDIVTFSVPNVELRGDTLVVCRSNSQTGSKKVFRFAFHTGFIEDGVLRVYKSEMDNAFKNKAFLNDFHVDMMFSEQASLPKLPGDAPRHNVWHPSESLRGMDIDEKQAAVTRSKFNDRLVDEDALLKQLYGVESIVTDHNMCWIKCELSVDRGARRGSVHETTQVPRIRLNLRPTLQALYLDEIQNRGTCENSGRVRSDQLLVNHSKKIA
mmetsp:Transcript_1715/g.5997  ORF Transcript_1715/g.5997 Transcript_1715/m.5997 type:complete len:460 (-) Transcript_1715:6547-7926(-)